MERVPMPLANLYPINNFSKTFRCLIGYLNHSYINAFDIINVNYSRLSYDNFTIKTQNIVTQVL